MNQDGFIYHKTFQRFVTYLLVWRLLFASIIPFCNGEFIDYAQYIPEDDLNAIQSAEISVGLSTSNGLYQDDIIGCTPSARPPCPMQTTKPAYYKLPDGMVAIPYMVEPDVDESLMDDIVAALENMGNVTACLHFFSVDEADARQIPNNPMIRFANGEHCAAEFGGAKNPMHKVYLNANCISTGETGKIQQLLMLAMGFPHEHVRSDRDEYVIINWENVIPEKVPEFDKNDPGIFDTLPYDYDSLLHPGYVFLGQVATVPTIMGKTKVKLGQRQQLSAGDVKKLQSVVCQGTVQQASPRPKPTPTQQAKPESKRTSIVTVTVTSTLIHSGSFISAPQTCNPGDFNCGAESSGDEMVKPSMALPVMHCPVRQMVVMHNTQTLSKTSIYPNRKRFQHSTKMSTWWFGQTEAGATKDYLAQPVDHPQFLGAVRSVETKMADENTRIFQTEYQSSILSDGGTLLQEKFETRVMRCQDPKLKVH